MRKLMIAERTGAAILVALGFGSSALGVAACGLVWGFDDLLVASDTTGSDGGRSTDAGDDDRATNPDAMTRPTALSCTSLSATCGSDAASNCCDSPLVPGGSYARSYDGVVYTDSKYRAKVSDFRLDRFEVTIGRFRAFTAGYPSNLLRPGDGRNPNDLDDEGWDATWSSFLPASKEALVDGIKVCTPLWSDSPGANELKPMPCITWYEAFAFCVWDGGRLPSEAEWNYAAAGGSEQRARPWSSPPTSTIIDASYAVFGRPGPSPTTDDVGSRSPKGDGKWGHSDLIGNLIEWTRDTAVDPYRINPCNDCSEKSDGGTAQVRGGSWANTDNALYSSRRASGPRQVRLAYVGVRCARTP